MGSPQSLPTAEQCARLHRMRAWPAGEYARFQPRTAEFQRAVGGDVRGALEAALARHSALTQGDWIRVPFAGQDFDLLVQKTRPGKAVSVIGPCTIPDLAASCGSIEACRQESRHIIYAERKISIVRHCVGRCSTSEHCITSWCRAHNQL